MEIKSLSKEIFNNHYSQELFDEYKEWLPYIIDIYAPIRDSENGDFRFLPFEGSLMDQPYNMMLVLKEIQNAYREVVQERMEARMKGVNKKVR